jgi:sugar/nucleoside kinase (ribokinase family)
MMSDFDLVVVGDCNADLLVSGGDVVPAFGQQERLVSQSHVTIGGSGGIFAAGAARLGLRVAMVGVVGDDLFGGFMRDSLAARNVDVSAVRVTSRTPTGLSIHLIRDDDRAIITNPGTIPQLRAEDIDADLLASARHVHVSAYFLQSGLWPGLPGLLRRARAGGATISLDPNWDPAETWDQGLSDVYGLLDVLLPNEAEVVELAGAARPRTAPSARRTPLQAAQALATAGPGSVVVKLGAQGALAVLPDDEVIGIPAVPGVRPVDAVGAGDSFDAGFLAATLWGWDTRRALALGAACGALSTRRAGGTEAQATREEAIATASELIGEVLVGS